MATPDSSPSSETSSIRERVGRWLDSTPVQVTIVALILVARRAEVPAALMAPYRRGER